MIDAILYLGKIRLPVNPAKIHFRIPTMSARYELIGAGEAEILQGARLAEIEIEGFLPAEARYYAPDADSPQSYVDAIRELVESGEPFSFVYVGQSWDINFLCSMQSPVFSELGGSFDVEYKFTLRKWVEIQTQTALKPETRPRNTEPRPSAASYTVKQGDTLSHIAQYTLGSSTRWPDIYDLNRDVIGNPNLIYPGQELKLPDDSSTNVVPQRSVSTQSSSRSSGSRHESSTNRKSDASAGANANTISPVSSVSQSTPRSAPSAQQRSNPSPASPYHNAASFYDDFAP